MAAAREQPVRFNRLPPIAVVAISLALGMAAAGITSVSLSANIVVLSITTLLAAVAGVRRFANGVSFSLTFLAIFLVGFLRGQLSPLTLTESRLQHFCNDGAVDVVAEGRIASTPILHRRPLTALAPRMYGPPQQTRFVFHLSKLRIGDDVHEIDARCRTYVSGRAAERLSAADMVSISGRLDWPKSPGNPNEFDFRAFLLRHNMDGMLFVDAESDLVVTQPTSYWDHRRWLSRLRSELYRILARYVGDDVRGIANALLLGSRHELPPETQHAFMASGTMHLLAISGLHVGILWMVTLQMFHVLLVPRRLALVITLMVCVVYALLTDLRPSVFRATVFLAVFVAGQLLKRDQQMSALLAVTGIIMLLYDPTLVFEVGSWLSFLSVAALGWLGSTANINPDEREAPPDAITLTEQIAYLIAVLRVQLGTRYRQTMAILLFTSPLVASTFHIVSPIGIVLNLALIPANRRGAVRRIRFACSGPAVAGSCFRSRHYFFSIAFGPCGNRFVCGGYPGQSFFRCQTASLVSSGLLRHSCLRASDTVTSGNSRWHRPVDHLHGRGRDLADGNRHRRTPLHGSQRRAGQRCRRRMPRWRSVRH